jgi:hypothetical protein
MSRTFSPGDKAPFSGLYVAAHSDGHAESHYVTVLYGDTFPSCLICSKGARFELAVAAVHIDDHPLFHRDA